MGGWSIGFHREGFDCKGVDIVDVGYPYKLIQADVRELTFKIDVDVVVASPPCTEFSPLTKLSWRKGQRGPPNPEKGMELVMAGMRVISQANPKFWLLENVKGAIPYFEKIPHLGEPRAKIGSYCLWGNFPGLDFDGNPNKGGDKIGLPEESYRDPLRSWKRARIPVQLSLAVARACKEELSKASVKMAEHK
jgi:hypothetical protein